MERVRIKRNFISNLDILVLDGVTLFIVYSKLTTTNVIN